jgi:hypothetical protein
MGPQQSPDGLRFLVSHLSRFHTSRAVTGPPHRDRVILGRCPICDRDSIVGHRRPSEQAHNDHQACIPIRRGRCPDWISEVVERK